MMNPLSAYNLGEAEKICYRCRRVFKSRRVFENHLKTHLDVAKLQRYKQNGSDSSQIFINSSSSNLSLHGTTGNSFGLAGNYPLVSTAAKNLDVMSPNLSSATNRITCSEALAPIRYHRNPDCLFKDSNLQHEVVTKKFSSMKEPIAVRNFLSKDATSVFSTSDIMNYAQGKCSDDRKGKGVQREYAHSCCYCSKVFNDYHALGAHLRAHQEEMKKRANRNYTYAGPSRNHIDTTTSNPFLSMNSLAKTCSLSKGENGNGDPMPSTQLTLSLNYSYASNKKAFSTTSCVRTLPMDCPSYMGSYDIPLGHSSNISSTGIHQFNAVGSRCFPMLTNTNTQRNNPPYPTCNSKTKRTWLGVQGNETAANSWKRPKINFIPPAFRETTTRAEKKELLLVTKDANLGKEKPVTSDNEAEADLDLSLHL